MLPPWEALVGLPPFKAAAPRPSGAGPAAAADRAQVEIRDLRKQVEMSARALLQADEDAAAHRADVDGVRRDLARLQLTVDAQTVELGGLRAALSAAHANAAETATVFARAASALADAGQRCRD